MQLAQAGMCWSSTILPGTMLGRSAVVPIQPKRTQVRSTMRRQSSGNPLAGQDSSSRFSCKPVEVSGVDTMAPIHDR